MLARVQSWTSSSKPVSSILRHQFGHPRDSSLMMTLRSWNHLRKPRGTRPGESGIRYCSPKPRPARQIMDPSRQEGKLTKTLVFRQQNGTRSRRSSIMGSVAAHFSIVQWVAGLETRADMLICVLSVARIILGTATTEQGISNPLQVCGSHLEGQNPSQRARMIMWLIHLWQCLRRILRFGILGRTFPRILEKWRPLAAGLWKSFQALLDSRRPFGQVRCLAYLRSTLHCVQQSLSHSMLWILINGSFSRNWSFSDAFSLHTLVLHATAILVLAKMMGDLPHCDRRSSQMASQSCLIRISALFSWATCSMRGPVKLALLSSRLVVISRSRILWGASYGKLHLWSSSFGTLVHGGSTWISVHLELPLANLPAWSFPINVCNARCIRHVRATTFMKCSKGRSTANSSRRWSIARN